MNIPGFFFLYIVLIPNLHTMKGYQFSKFDPGAEGKSKFEQLLDVFMQLLTYTSGDVSEAMNWMNQLDKEYELTDEEYGMGDFIDELKEKGYIQRKPGKWRDQNHLQNGTGHPEKNPGRNFRQTEENRTGRSPDF